MSSEKASLWIGTSLDACALWRMHMPHLNREKAKFLIFPGRADYAKVAPNEVVSVQRCFSKPQLDFLMACKTLGLKIIYDLDDNIFNIPSYNPFGAFLMECREGFKTCMSLVDVVTVSTKRLKLEIESHNVRNPKTNKAIPVLVAENRMDTRLFSDPLPPQEEPILIGWAGSSSHIGDLALIEEPLERVIQENQSVQFEFRGLAPSERILRHPNVKFRTWVPVSEFCARMPHWGYAVTLAPVTNHPFNECKSAIKAVEAGWCGIPCLMSWVGAYEEFAYKDRAGDLKWLLCASSESWYRKLTELIHNPERRKILGARMGEITRAHYTFADGHEQWDQVFEAVS